MSTRLPTTNSPLREISPAGRNSQEKVRKDFPILQTKMNGFPLTYFDNAATTQKPQTVIGAEKEFYTSKNANVHRGMYTLAENATLAFENIRQHVRTFIHARHAEEIIFTKGTTESINLAMQTWGRQSIHTGDIILLSEMEHHANLVPWQQLALQTGAALAWIPVTDNGRLDMKAFAKLLELRPRLLAISAMSNVLGTINPMKEIVRKAHAAGVTVLVDAAQMVAHHPIDVESWDADFVAFSSHKMYGPTGIGVLYGKKELLDAMPPFLFGGDMIIEVQKDQSEWNELPYKFEGGTPNIAGVIGLGAAMAYLESLGWDWIEAQEARLTEKLLTTLQSTPDVRIIGPTDLADRGSVVSFTVGNIHPHDLATVLDSEGIAVRSGHHCAQVLMERFSVPATVRASLAFYNTEEEIERLPKAIAKAKKILT